MSYLVRWKTAACVLLICYTFSVVLGAPQGTVVRNFPSNGPLVVEHDLDSDEFRPSVQHGNVNSNGRPIAITRAWLNFGDSARQSHQNTGISLSEANQQLRGLQSSSSVATSSGIGHQNPQKTGITLAEANKRFRGTQGSSASAIVSTSGKNHPQRAGITLTEANERLRSIQRSSPVAMSPDIGNQNSQRSGISLADANERLRGLQGSSTGAISSTLGQNHPQRTGITLSEANNHFRTVQMSSPVTKSSGIGHQNSQRAGITLDEANKRLRGPQGSSGQNHHQRTGITLAEANGRLRGSTSSSPVATLSGTSHQQTQRTGITLAESNSRLRGQQGSTRTATFSSVPVSSRKGISSPFFVIQDSAEESDFSEEDSSSSTEIVISLGRRFHPHGIPVLSSKPVTQPSPRVDHVPLRKQEFSNPFIQTLNSIFVAKTESDFSIEDDINNSFEEYDFNDGDDDDDDDDIVVHLSPMIRAHNPDTSNERLSLSNDFMSQYNFVDRRGSVNWGYKTDDQHQAHKVHDDGTMEGQFGWTSPEGSQVKIKYIADERGYRVISQSGTYLNDNKDVRLAKEKHFAAHEKANTRIKNIRNKNYGQSNIGIPLPPRESSHNNVDQPSVGIPLPGQSVGQNSFDQGTSGIPLPARDTNVREDSFGVHLPESSSGSHGQNSFGVPLPGSSSGSHGQNNFGIPLPENDVSHGQGTFGVPLPGSSGGSNGQNSFGIPLPENTGSHGQNSFGVPLPGSSSGSHGQNNFGIPLPENDVSQGQGTFGVPLPGSSGGSNGQNSFGIPLPENTGSHGQNSFGIPLPGSDTNLAQDGFDVSLPGSSSGSPSQNSFGIPLPGSDTNLAQDGFGVSLPGSSGGSHGQNSFGIPLPENEASQGQGTFGVPLPGSSDGSHGQNSFGIPLPGSDTNLAQDGFGVSLPGSSSGSPSQNSFGIPLPGSDTNLAQDGFGVSLPGSSGGSHGQNSFGIPLPENEASPGQGTFGVTLPGSSGGSHVQNSFGIPLPENDGSQGQGTFGVSLSGNSGSHGQNNFDVPLPGSDMNIAQDSFGIPLQGHKGGSDGQHSIGVSLPGNDASRRQDNFGIQLPGSGSSVGQDNFGTSFSGNDASQFGVPFPGSDVTIGQDNSGILLPVQNFGIHDNSAAVNFDGQNNFGIPLRAQFPNEPAIDGTISSSVGVSLPKQPIAIFTPNLGTQHISGTTDQNIGIPLSDIKINHEISSINVGVPLSDLNPNEVTSAHNFDNDLASTLPALSNIPNRQNFGIPLRNIISNIDTTVPVNNEQGFTDHRLEETVVPFGIVGVELPQSAVFNSPPVTTIGSNFHQISNLNDPSTNIIGIPIPSFKPSELNPVNALESSVGVNLQFDNPALNDPFSPNLLHEFVNQAGRPNFGDEHGVRLPQFSGIDSPPFISNAPGFVETGPLDDLPLASPTPLNNNVIGIPISKFGNSGVPEGQTNSFSNIGTQHGVELPQFNNNPIVDQIEPFSNSPVIDNIQSVPDTGIQLSFDRNSHIQPFNNENFGIGLASPSSDINRNVNHQEKIGIIPFSTHQGPAPVNVGIGLPPININTQTLDFGTGSGGFSVLPNDESRFGFSNKKFFSPNNLDSSLNSGVPLNPSFNEETKFIGGAPNTNAGVGVELLHNFNTNQNHSPGVDLLQGPPFQST